MASRKTRSPPGYDPKNLSSRIDDRDATDAFRVQEYCDLSDRRLGGDRDDVSRHYVGSSQHGLLLIIFQI